MTEAMREQNVVPIDYFHELCGSRQ